MGNKIEAGLGGGAFNADTNDGKTGEVGDDNIKANTRPTPTSKRRWR
jgi:hypothetical protein